jgi:phosphoesterase RecJ-like protein
VELEIQKKILQKMTEYENYLITAHPTPDGDALGACIAYYYALKNAGKKATIMVHGYLEHKYKFLLENIPYSVFPENIDVAYQCIVVLDVGDRKRVQEILEKTSHQKPFVINIDHHASNRGFANIDLIDASASSCGEMVYYIFKTGKIEFTSAIATALYAAIATDTGFFTYSNTTSASLQASSELLALGADIDKISHHVIRSKPLSVFQLEAEYLSSLQFSTNRHLAWGMVSKELCKKYNTPLF